MYNKTLIDRLTDAKDDVVELCTLRAVEIATTVLFLYAFLGGRRRWLNVIHVIMLAESVCGLICPKTFIGYFFEGTPDDTHLQLAKITFLLQLCWVLNYWLLSKSTDNTAETTILLCGTVVVCASSLASVYGLSVQSKKSALRISEEAKVPIFYMQLLLVVINVYYYLSAKDWGGYGEITSRANTHLRADFVFLIVMGLLMYALPQWMIRLMSNVDKVDSGHAILCRGCGSWLLGMALMSGRSANFLRNSDKDTVAFSHLMFYKLLFVLSVWNAFQGWADLEWKQTGLKILHDLILCFNAAGALNFDRSALQKILLPRLRAIPSDIRSCECWPRWLKSKLM